MVKPNVKNCVNFGDRHFSLMLCLHARQPQLLFLQSPSISVILMMVQPSCFWESEQME